MANKEALRELQSRLAERMQHARTAQTVQSWLAVECRGLGVLLPLEQAGEIFTRRILVEMNENDLDALFRGLSAFVRASDHVSRVEPNLAVVAMPGAAS